MPETRADSTGHLVQLTNARLTRHRNVALTDGNMTGRNRAVNLRVNGLQKFM